MLSTSINNDRSSGLHISSSIQRLQSPIASVNANNSSRLLSKQNGITETPKRRNDFNQRNDNSSTFNSMQRSSTKKNYESTLSLGIRQYRNENSNYYSQQQSPSKRSKIIANRKSERLLKAKRIDINESLNVSEHRLG